MDGLIWQDRLNIGVEELDNDHKKLFSIMNKLIKLCSDKDTGQFGCQEAIKYFENYSAEHIKREEAYMRVINYSGYEMHKRLHDNFRSKILPSLEQELIRTNYSMDAIRHFISVYVGWLTGHTMTEDQAITGKRSSKWEIVPPEKEKAAFESTVIQIFKEIFDLNAHTINEYYDGEDFGNVIHHYLLYQSKTGEKWEIIMTYEDQLLLNTMGNVLGYTLNEIDDVVLNTTRYFTRHFLNRICENFPNLSLCEVKEESFMPHEQFTKIYDKDQYRHSFLFDSGEGYLAICLVMPESGKTNITNSFKEDEAMASIKKFLNTNSNQKKRILVVDDSSVMRQSLKTLLCEDYEIILVDSGMAAIKSITLNRPDLVLMDYEMPVCDGRQTFAMIRSDKETADIPVIFLTGRGDKESIMNVMSLNPEGYLLKSTAHPELKKSIDTFFQKKK